MEPAGRAFGFAGGEAGSGYRFQLRLVYVPFSRQAVGSHFGDRPLTELFFSVSGPFPLPGISPDSLPALKAGRDAVDAPLFRYGDVHGHPVSSTVSLGHPASDSWVDGTRRAVGAGNPGLGKEKIKRISIVSPSIPGPHTHKWHSGDGARRGNPPVAKYG